MRNTFVHLIKGNFFKIKSPSLLICICGTHIVELPSSYSITIVTAAADPLCSFKRRSSIASSSAFEIHHVSDWNAQTIQRNSTLFRWWVSVWNFTIFASVAAFVRHTMCTPPRKEQMMCCQPETDIILYDSVTWTGIWAGIT